MGLGFKTDQSHSKDYALSTAMLSLLLVVFFFYCTSENKLQFHKIPEIACPVFQTVFLLNYKNIDTVFKMGRFKPKYR